MMEQRINSEVYINVEVLNKPMNFPLSISPSKEMGDRMRQRKRSDSRQGQTFFSFTCVVFHFLTRANAQ